MSSHTLQHTAVQTDAMEVSDRRAILIATLLGLGLVFLAGFAPASVLHNAAHDFRHVQSYPCH